LGVFFWWRGTLFQQRWLLWVFVFSVLGPEMANELGWFSAEVGRQPWIVYNVMLTSQGISPHLAAGDVLGSIIMFGFIYLLLGLLFVFLMNRKIQQGPAELPVELSPPKVAEAHGRLDA
jgi:cytochrome d ubiquinol oxidase subunit I